MKFRGILGALALCACAFVGCNHDDGGSTPSTRIRVSVEAGTTTTRTDFQNGQSTWSAGDMIEVAAYEVDGSSVLLSTDLTANAGGSTSATFVGSIDKAVGEQKIPAGKTYDYVAAYPADKVTINGKTVSFTVENAYTVTPNQLNGHLFDFMVAKADDCASIAVTEPAIAEHPAFSFEHMLAFLEITLTGNDSIKTVTVTAPSQICGKVSADLSDGTPSFGYTPSDDNKTITVTINGTLDGGETLYVPVIPGIAHTGTLTVELTCKSGSTHTITKTLNGKTFTRGLVTKVSKVGYELGDESIQMSDVMTYLEGNDGSLNADQLQVSATTNFPTKYSGNGGEGVTFYWRTAADAESVKNAVESDGSAFVVTPSIDNKTFTLKVSDLNDIQLVVWAEVNHNGKTQKSNTDTEVYVLGSGDVISDYGAYTTYSIYQSQGASAANSSNYAARSIYNVGYKLNKNIPARLNPSITVTQNGTVISNPNGGTLTNQALRAHTFKGSITIGGKEYTNFAKEAIVHVTGLPYSISINTSATAKDSYFVTQMGWINNGGSWYTALDYYIQQQQSSDYVISPEFHIPSSSLNVTTTVKAFSISTSKNNRLAYVGAVARTATAGAKDVQFEVKYDIGTAQNVSNSMVLYPAKPCVSLTKYNSSGNNRIEGISISYR